MNVFSTIETILPKDFKTLQFTDSVGKAKEIFDKHPTIQQIPIINFEKINGLLHKVDLNHFLKGSLKGQTQNLVLEKSRLRFWKVNEIMKKEITTLQKDTTILEALKLFKKKRVPCILIFDQHQVIGLLTPYDIIHQNLKETINK